MIQTLSNIFIIVLYYFVVLYLSTKKECQERGSCLEARKPLPLNCGNTSSNPSSTACQLYGLRKNIHYKYNIIKTYTINTIQSVLLAIKCIYVLWWVHEIACEYLNQYGKADSSVSGTLQGPNIFSWGYLPVL